jgi:ABC-type transporter Mla MlaB component
MVASNCMTIRPAIRFLSHKDALSIADHARSARQDGLVVLDLSDTSETTTAALACLIVLRQKLLRSGRDLRLTGLSGRAESLYQICRLKDLLPRS